MREFITVSCVLGKSRLLGISQYCIFCIDLIAKTRFRLLYVKVSNEALPVFHKLVVNVKRKILQCRGGGREGADFSLAFPNFLTLELGILNFPSSLVLLFLLWKNKEVRCYFVVYNSIHLNQVFCKRISHRFRSSGERNLFESESFGCQD